MKFLLKASIAILAVFIAGHDARAVNNPLNTIKADGFDSQSGGIKTEVCSEGGRDICSIHDGNYAVYKILILTVALPLSRQGLPRQTAAQ